MCGTAYQISLVQMLLQAVVQLPDVFNGWGRPLGLQSTPRVSSVNAHATLNQNRQPWKPLTLILYRGNSRTSPWHNQKKGWVEAPLTFPSSKNQMLKGTPPAGALQQ